MPIANSPVPRLAVVCQFDGRRARSLCPEMFIHQLVGKAQVEDHLDLWLVRLIGVSVDVPPNPFSHEAVWVAATPDLEARRVIAARDLKLGSCPGFGFVMPCAEDRDLRAFLKSEGVFPSGAPPSDATGQGGPRKVSTRVRVSPSQLRVRGPSSTVCTHATASTVVMLGPCAADD